MFSDLHISVAQSEEIPALTNLINAAYRGEGSAKAWTTEKEFFDGVRTNEKALTKLLADENAVMLKYTDDSKRITGCVYLQKQDNKIYLGLLSVSPDAQASGVGKKLFQAADEYAYENNFNKITMTVISVRHELIAWYKRRGYKHTGEIIPFPEDEINTPNQPLELLVFEKEI
jgi:ribosomal protein S18 acetylase RimI-like enzyme